MHICDKCGKAFIMRDYLRNHTCKIEKEEIKEEELTRKELIQMAKDSGVKGSDRMSKEELIEALA
jgi:arsenate reductase-like glutaredoxin family protein